MDSICSGCVSHCCSCFVISLLGLQGKTMTSKGILNVVGAMMFPGGANARLGLLACYLLVIFGLLLLAIHIVFVCQFVDEIWKIICVWRKSGGMRAAGMIRVQSYMDVILIMQWIKK